MFHKIKSILTARGKPCDPLKDFTLRDDGAGPYIAAWNEDALGPKPTQAELDAIDTAAMERTVDIDRQIAALEAKITTRMLVDAAAGTPFAGYTSIVNQIAALREERRK